MIWEVNSFIDEGRRKDQIIMFWYSVRTITGKNTISTSTVLMREIRGNNSFMDCFFWSQA